MQLNTLIRSRTALAVACGVVLVGAIATEPARADEWNKRTVLTVNEPIQIRDTYLQPGQYVLKLYNSPAERHVVQIFNSDESRIINTVFAVPKQRYEVSGHSEFTFWETPAGKVRALRAWFYPGDQIGQEFPYPKHLRDAMTETSRTTQATSTEQAAAPPQPMTTEETTTQSVQTAENTPPPPVEQPPAPPAETPAAAPPSAPYQGEANRAAELPKTASPYPLIGFAGLLLIGLSGLIRFRLWA